MMDSNLPMWRNSVAWPATKPPLYDAHLVSRMMDNLANHRETVKSWPSLCLLEPPPSSRFELQLLKITGRVGDGRLTSVHHELGRKLEQHVKV